MAENGTDAWGSLMPLLLTLLDKITPGIDGIKLCRRMRTLGSNGIG